MPALLWTQVGLEAAKPSAACIRQMTGTESFYSFCCFEKSLSPVSCILKKLLFPKAKILPGKLLTGDYCTRQMLLYLSWMFWAYLLSAKKCSPRMLLFLFFGYCSDKPALLLCCF